MNYEHTYVVSCAAGAVFIAWCVVHDIYLQDAWRYCGQHHQEHEKEAER